jgi:hypothetical protein
VLIAAAQKSPGTYGVYAATCAGDIQAMLNRLALDKARLPDTLQIDSITHVVL